MYRAVTRNIEVLVRPFYLEDRSDPSENRYVWGYQVTIDNRSDDFVQLLSRYWHITDGQG
ncbi:ApaG domain, partial [Mesorhizobium sp. M2A.F.Ca.ET.039.01.1.1]